MYVFVHDMGLHFLCARPTQIITNYIVFAWVMSNIYQATL